MKENTLYKKTVKYNFRIVNINLNQKNKIEMDLSIYPFEFGKYFKNKLKFTAFFELKENYGYTQLVDFLKRNPELKRKYGVYIYCITTQDHDGISIPEYVMQILRLLECTLDFSFSCDI